MVDARRGHLQGSVRAYAGGQTEVGAGLAKDEGGRRCTARR